MKNILTTFILFLGFNLDAQQTFVPGYVVELSGDTLKGEIKINPKKELDLYTRVAFKDANGLQKTYKPGKIKSYGFDKSVFISGVNDDEPVFLKVLSSGILNLYSLQYEVLQMNELKTKHDYFMKPRSGESLIKIKHGRFKKQLAEHMADATELVKKIEEDKHLEFENIALVFDQYNTWAQHQQASGK